MATKARVLTMPRVLTKARVLTMPERAAAGATRFKHLSDPVRLQVILTLADRKEAYVGELCEALGMAQPAVSHHLALMRVGGIVESDRRAKQVFYRLTYDGVRFAEFARQFV